MKVARVELGLSQQGLAEAIGARQQQVARWETGSTPSGRWLSALAAALGIPSERILRAAALDAAEQGAPVATDERDDAGGLDEQVEAIAGRLDWLVKQVELQRMRIEQLELARATCAGRASGPVARPRSMRAALVGRTTRCVPRACRPTGSRSGQRGDQRPPSRSDGRQSAAPRERDRR